MELDEVISEFIELGIINDYCGSYGEPGYTNEGLILLGDWWCNDRDCDYTETYDDGRKEDSRRRPEG